MSYIKAGQDANGEDIKLHYTDQGQDTPVVLIHGWPQSHEAWTYQLGQLPKHGLRVVAYTRRGFGNSSKPYEGYDYDTLADDLKAVLDTLNLQNVTLVGHSTGGGEVARYMSRHGGARVAKVAFVSSMTPTCSKPTATPTAWINRPSTTSRKTLPRTGSTSCKPSGSSSTVTGRCPTR